MKIVCIYGSPRKKGNSATMANHFLDTLVTPDDDVKKFELNRLNYQGCQGCNTCKSKSEKCVLKDDLEEVLESVKETDLLVIATPVYYWDITGQLKCFIDRTWSYVKPDYLTNPAPSRLSPGKTLVFIQAQEDSNPDTHSDIYPKIKSFFSLYGFDKSELIRACGVGGPDEAKKRSDIMGQAEEIAMKIKQAKTG